MDDANLSKLSVKNFLIEPKFEKNVTEYSLTVPSNADTIEIEATTSDSSASYFIKYKEKDGNKCKLQEGLNKIIIEVSSEDGTTKLYNISCQRLSASDAALRSLIISEVTLEPKFGRDIFEYLCVVPYNQINATIDAQVDDPKCEIKLVYNSKEHIKANNSNLTIDFNYGMTYFEVQVKSPDATKIQAYKVTSKKQLQPRYIKFKNQNDSILYEDPISLAPLYCATKLKGLDNVYSEPFIEYFYNLSKQDFLSGSYLDSENSFYWKVYANDVEANLAKCEVTVPLINGENSETKAIRETGPLIQDVPKVDQLKTQGQVQFILEFDSNLNDMLHKYEMHRPWEKKLQKIYDETDPQKLQEMSDKHLHTYFQLRDSHVPRKVYEKDNSPLDFLDLSIFNCAAAVKYKNHDHELHFKMAMLLEEKHHIEDVFGFKNEEESDDNDDFSLASNKKAKESSREEEIDAICKLRNVPASGTMEQKLKALDEEYHSLLQSGQTHKAEQVQLLYHFKVQQTKMDASLSSKAGDNQKPLGQAYVKYLDALYLSESIKITKYLYHFHVGRMYCMRSNFLLAIKHLTICLPWNSDEYSSLVRFYLGYALSLEKTVLKTRYEEATYYLCQGLQIFLTKLSIRSKDHEPKLFAQNLYSLTNPAFLQAFINLASISSSYKITKFNYITVKDSLHSCAWLCCQALNQISLHCVDTVKNLIKTSDTIKQINWLLVKAHSNLLEILSNTLNNQNNSKEKLYKKLIEKRCFYLSALLRNLNKDNNLEILNLQENICQKLVVLNPCDNYFLYLLANSQLEKYDFEIVYSKNESNNVLLNDCKNTLLASIELENKPAAGEPLSLIAEQKWWIETTAKKEEKAVEEVKPPSAKEPGAQQKPEAVPGKAATGTKPAGKAPAPAKAASVKPAPKAAAAATPAKPNAAAANKKPTPAKADADCKHNKTGQDTKPAVETPAAAPVAPSQPAPELPKPASARDEPAKINKKISSTRLLLARVYLRLDDIQNSKKYYNEVIEADPNNHDAYIELADMLKSKGDHLGAVDVYTKFKSGYSTLSFDDAYIFGEIVSILMKHEKYDDLRLVKYMVLWAKVLGIGVLERYIKKLDEKNKTKVCKEVYCGVHNKSIDDPELQNFFKFKGWA